MMGAGLLALLLALFTYVPIWLKSQEQLVLTEEALLQMLQPTLFASKISQLNLKHVADVSVRQGLFGGMFGYGKITVETPGEQDDYGFYMVPNAEAAAKQIIEAHENYQAALENGQLKTTLGTSQQQAPTIDAAEYGQFLAFQKMVADQKAAQIATSEAAPAQTDVSQQQNGAIPVPPAASNSDNDQLGQNVQPQPPVEQPSTQKPPHPPQQ